MKCLLDTHIFLWSLTGSENLPSKMRRALEQESNELWLSPISIWEVLMLCDKGKIKLSQKEPVKWIRGILKALPLKEAPLNHEVAIRSRQLSLLHQDPADRFILATALVYEFTLFTVDAKILESGHRNLCFEPE